MERWFFLRPLPAAPLFWAILLTQFLSILLCAFVWLVEPLSLELIAWILGYDLAWMFLLGAARQITENVF